MWFNHCKGVSPDLFTILCGLVFLFERLGQEQPLHVPHSLRHVSWQVGEGLLENTLTYTLLCLPTLDQLLLCAGRSLFVHQGQHGGSGRANVLMLYRQQPGWISCICRVSFSFSSHLKYNLFRCLICLHVCVIHILIQ